MSETNKIYVNIGLVGHVSNGKTTLVKCLTGVNTKRDSNEIKSGRTVKLGYANCLVWKCPICDTVFTTGQDQKKTECCSFELEPVQHISLVDAPGHHSYVHTMIKGTAIIDCAIIVTDVRATDLQQQTLEHLVILETLDVRNILVIQNKIDLVDEEQCKNNYAMLKKELKGTVAEGAPIIPISAQSGKGIENVKKYIYKMAEKALQHMRSFKHNVFTVIRSFDINHPNTEPERLRGGVLGGTVIGQSGYRVGDVVEIRPGFLHGDKYYPLTTQILSIFSESKSCKDMGRGGLYGLGTRLDPSLTKADGLVGCLVGKPNELPQVITELIIQVNRMKKFIDGTDTPKIQVGTLYQLIIGSTVVKASVSKKIEHNVFLFSLTKPLCTVSNRCLIYTADFKLLGCGLFGEQEGHRANLNIQQTENEYISLLPGSSKVQKEKVSIPIPSLARENKNIIWANMVSFCEVVKREPDQVTTYIRQELCLEASICQSGLRLYKTRINPQKLQTILRKYIIDNVCCAECKSIDTILQKGPLRISQIHCETCGSDRSVVN
jgi:translation initiation factor 2 subunit 3